MSPSKDDKVIETETVEVQVEKGTRDPVTRGQVHGIIATHLQKWMSQEEAEREADSLLDQIEEIAPVVK